MKLLFDFETTQFDFDLINHVKKLRKIKGFTKDDLSIKMGVAKSFVGNVESYTQRHKYSTRHITLLAKAFGYKNIGELLDFPTPQYDRIRVTVEQTYNEAGTKVLKSEVVKIEVI
ncbi:helix-turn-helix domain-containing protein [Faecalibacter rhinopitheci]|uniref:Helix-turn-helix transcriptional regulator n=1 Tax=Faecalibacter rhinopitheci TaxID=2779678 RepID=A0A8J7FSV2_9FLAO|nr:helix-turn-helix transcriptional regulator [Faecalibacter rhinopitheci]MBF0598288.1 helix-turn-helix transcriptional regulator [Faecalibacter rhinopitheci]